MPPRHPHTIEERTIALAGIYQACDLVHQIATRGLIDSEPFEYSIQSLFVTEPENTLAIYQSHQALRHGYRVLVAQYQHPPQHLGHPLIAYPLGVFRLLPKIQRQPERMAQIATAIEQAQQQVAHFSVTHPNVIAALADCYGRVISPIKPQIMVSGAHGHLQNPNNANRIRALLLATVRAAILWQQVGGRWYHLLFRRQMVEVAQRQLRQIDANASNHRSVAESESAPPPE